MNRIQIISVDFWAPSSVKKKNKPGTAQVGAISKAQKYQKDFKMSKYWWIGHPFMKFFFEIEFLRWCNKPGTAQVGAISKAQKQQKDFQVFSSTVPKKPKSWTELAHQRRHFEIFHPFCRKSSKKVEGGALLVKIFFKVSQCRKNWKGGPFGIFQHPFCRKTPKKLKGGPFGKFFFSKKKSHRAENTPSPFGPFEFLRWCKNTTSQAFKVFYLNLLSKNCKLLGL